MSGRERLLQRFERAALATSKKLQAHGIPWASLPKDAPSIAHERQLLKERKQEAWAMGLQAECERNAKIRASYPKGVVWVELKLGECIPDMINVYIQRAHETGMHYAMSPNNREILVGPSDKLGDGEAVFRAASPRLSSTERECSELGWLIYGHDNNLCNLEYLSKSTRDKGQLCKDLRQALTTDHGNPAAVVAENVHTPEEVTYFLNEYVEGCLQDLNSYPSTQQLLRQLHYFSGRYGCVAHNEIWQDALKHNKWGLSLEED